MDNSSNAVPYQPYRSKRHSRTLSALSSEPTPTVERDVPIALTLSSPSPPLPPSLISPSAKTEVYSSFFNTPLPSSCTAGILKGDTGSPVVSSSPTPSSSNQPSPNNSSLDPLPITTQTTASTFRRIPLRVTSAQYAPSPLRSNHTTKLSSHSLTVSPSLSRQSSLRQLGSQPRLPAQELFAQSTANFPSPTPSRRISSLSASSSPPSASSPPIPDSSITASSVQNLAVTSTPATHAITPTSTVQLSPPSPPNPAVARRPTAPYLPGFQPKGVYRPRTDEFIAARSSVRDRDKVEQHRLERRLEKLIQLHFPRSSLTPPPRNAKGKPPASRRASSLFDFDFSKNPTDIWREVIESRIQGPKAIIRAEEQIITPWEDDAIVSHCPLCNTSFHTITNRKHHCRLCGRVVCSLPPRPPARTQMCSILFVVDQRTDCIEEVGEGVDYGVKRRNSGNDKAEEEDKFLKGVRICRDCKPALLRQQYLQEAQNIPTFALLYSTLVSLEKEIEEALPHFQELILSLSTETSSSQYTSSAAIRKRLLDSFAEYDRLSKKIRQLPAKSGGSQDRVQSAILTRANLFLQKNMFPLQTIPKSPKKTNDDASPPTPIVDTDSRLAHTLQPLLEQEALLESFVEEAKAQRKFEDARTLKASLAEIRAEIERIAQIPAAPFEPNDKI